jgi:hypothetical protein
VQRGLIKLKKTIPPLTDTCSGAVYGQKYYYHFQEKLNKKMSGRGRRTLGNQLPELGPGVET